MPVTRIKNNQITDSSAGNIYLGVNAAAKLQDYSITSGKIANDLTYNSSLTITGNLTVQGNTTQIDTVNLIVEDPLILLAKEQTGAPALDIGYIGKRGTEENIAFVWDESSNAFATGFTTSETTNTTITITSYANLITNNLAADTVDVTGNITGANLDIGNGITAGTTIVATGNITGDNVIANLGVYSSTLETTGNALIGGNLIVQGNITYINIDDLRVEDPIIILGTGPNGAPLSVDDGKDRGVYMEYYTSGLGNAFVGWQNSTGNIIIANDVEFSANDVVQVNAFGTLEVGNIDAESGQIDGDLLVQSTANVNEFNAYGLTANIAGNLNIATTTSIDNVALNVDTTTSIKIPVGNTVQRPGTPVTGMIRFNTTTDSLEFYDADGWVSAGTVFTIVVSDQFNGDGSTTTYTLSNESTTAGTIISINGVVQIPTVAYAVAGNVLTFTEAPTVSDVIDARILTTSQTVTGLINLPGNAVLEGDATSSAFNITGNLIPSANGVYSLGSNVAQWAEVYIAGNSLYLGDIVIKDTGSNQIGFFQSDGSTPATIDSDNVDATEIANGTSNVAVVSSGGNVRFTIGGTAIIGITPSGIYNDQANGVGNIGAVGAYFNTVFAKATSAQYADLAEMYEANQIIESGTVVCFGGPKEIMICDEDSCRRVAGVVSTNPSYIMNAGLEGEYVVAVALTGRVPTRVTGIVRKGDMLVAAGDGRARAEVNPAVGQVIGKALADFDGQDGTIEVVVGRL